MPQRPAPVTDLAWSAERAQAFGGEMLGLWTELLERLPELPVNRELTPAEVAPAVALPVPEEPMPEEQLLAHLRELTFEQSLLMGHPGFFAYICGAGTVPGAAAELLAAGLNPCLGGYRLGPGANEIELHLTRWLAERFGLPEGSGGMIMTGGAMANFVALKCARDAALGHDVRERGVREHGPVALYASEEAHVVIRRAADMLGLGAASVRPIAIDAQQRMRADALEAAIRGDLRTAPGRSPSSRRPARRRPARSTRCRRSPRSRRSTASGSTSTPRTAAPPCCPTSCAACSPASRRPTRSRSTRTSGSTRRSPPAAC